MTHYEPKPAFLDRMKAILGEEFENYEKSLSLRSLSSIRINTLKISPEKLIQRLGERSWKISQPFNDFPEMVIVEGKYANGKRSDDISGINDEKKDAYANSQYVSDSERVLLDLEPGEIGRSMEHLLGYYYVQDISSMLPALSLNPEENELVVDLCAAPGSKTSQMSAMMNNKGTLIANDISIGRIKILASNLERCGSMNAIITKSHAESLCRKMRLQGFKVDKILVDAPCSGEGTIISSKKTALMWNQKRITVLSRMQKILVEKAFELLKENGTMVYSTCTHAPEENEEVIDFLLEKFKNAKLESVTIPKEMKFRHGLNKWKDKDYSSEVEKCVRIYPQDNKTEGFFIAKIRKV